MSHKGLRRRPARTAVAVAAALVAVSFGSVPFGSAQAAEDHARGLSATIRYTEFGIAHIVAHDYASLGYGQGYAAAGDNLCAIGEGMLGLDGRRSRFFGKDAAPTNTLSLASTNLASDLYFTGLNDSHVVDRLVDQPAPLGPEPGVRAMVRGYAAGYNAVLAEGGHTSCAGAAWLRPMTELDVYRRAYAWGLALGQSGTPDGIAAQPPTEDTPQADPHAAVPVSAPDLSGPGSNAVALGRDATANGRGISIGNPHLPWGGDFRFTQAQLTIPGRLDVSGASLLGLPMITLGHTGTLAWSGTIADAATPFTLFELKLVPGTPTSYLVDGRPEPMRRRDITVDVAQPDGTVRPETHTQWWTDRGPVVTSFRGLPVQWTTERAYALADPNAQNMRMLNWLFETAHARDVADLRSALRTTQGSPMFNILAADAKGDTIFSGMTVVANVTDEQARRCDTALGQQTFPKSGLAVLDGSRSDCAWATDRDAVQPGIFGPSNLPVQQRADYLANSNESYWLANATAPSASYPRVLGPSATERNVRTRDTLTEITDQLAREPFTRQSAQDLVLSNRMYAAELAVDGTVAMCRNLPGGHAVDSSGTTVDVGAACQALAGWDRHGNIDSRGALLFSRYWTRVARAAGLWLTPFDVNDPVRTPNTLDTANPLLPKALADAVDELRAAGIPLDAPLGEHQYVQVGQRRVPIGGGRGETGSFNVIASQWDPANGYDAIGAHLGQNSTSYLHVVAFNGTQCPDARTLLTYSQSADPTSPHANDQLDLFSRKQWVTDRFCQRDILASPVLRTVHIGTDG
ncbi:penicillin acylase family protein [Solihabitans fulvus]|uniref:Penicillin acylase family protein n=1 Tax=Solihabitans fulvus TaxID=1892852 RepID=A0A5B2XBX2_9PSEU|nr:penicillin acylase family protein [Solihabitans fulvus]KAA2261117.1 penicillin acylase family protein [Solihabitans fulvus]